jgi:methionyl-tRNA formyltransferase
MVETLRIVFFGTPAFAVPTLRALLASRHEICGVVTQPDRPRGRGHKVTASPIKMLALQHHLPLIQPERLRAPDVAETLRSWQPDLGVVAAYGRLIPEELLAIPPLGMINVHASLLPKYRGAAPVHRAVIDGEHETGVTIMRMVKLMDAGNMLAKVKRPIGPNETSDAVERDLAELGATLLLSVIDQIIAGTAREEIQDYMMSTHAPRLTKEEGLVDWSLPAIYVHNRVRGLYPWPHAYTYLNGERVILLKTQPEERRSGQTEWSGEEGSEDRDETLPGTIVEVERDGIHVATGHGGRIVITELQLQGGRPLRVSEFLAGHPVHPGAVFTGP